MSWLSPLLPTPLAWSITYSSLPNAMDLSLWKPIFWRDKQQERSLCKGVSSLPKLLLIQGIAKVNRIMPFHECRATTRFWSKMTCFSVRTDNSNILVLNYCLNDSSFWWPQAKALNCLQWRYLWSILKSHCREVQVSSVPHICLLSRQILAAVNCTTNGSTEVGSLIWSSK